MRKSLYTKTRQIAICKAYEQSKSVYQVQDLLGVSRKTVSRILKAHGIELYGRRSAYKRFQESYKVLNNGCWQWIGNCDKNGYGQFFLQRNHKVICSRAHRFSYAYHNGPIPKGYWVHHICENPPCVNPDHLKAIKPKKHLEIHGTLGFKKELKVKCPQGHPYAGKNLYINPYDGGRCCRICQQKHKRKYQRNKVTHCPHGHAYTPKNTRHKADGRRVCITCKG